MICKFKTAKSSSDFILRNFNNFGMRELQFKIYDGKNPYVYTECGNYCILVYPDNITYTTSSLFNALKSNYTPAIIYFILNAKKKCIT